MGIYHLDCVGELDHNFFFFFFLRDLCGEKQTTGALLTKYARSSMQNGIKVFNSRRPVAT